MQSLVEIYIRLLFPSQLVACARIRNGDWISTRTAICGRKCLQGVTLCRCQRDASIKHSGKDGLSNYENSYVHHPPDRCHGCSTLAYRATTQIFLTL